jgi:hypothetical protein
MKRTSTTSAVPSTDYCHTGLTHKGCPSTGQEEMAHQGGGKSAHDQEPTSGVHQGASFASGDPLACRVRCCFREAVRETLEHLELLAATPARSKGQDGSIVWRNFVHRTNH